MSFFIQSKDCVAGFVFTCMILLTLCGNTLVLVAIATNKSLQRPCNFFLASLAIADLGVSIYSISFAD